MADSTDVLNALVALATQAIYPNGTGQASAANGVPVKIYAGWPTESQLDADLLAGISHVSVYPQAMERNTTRFSTDWQQLIVNAPTLTATISGQTITIGGAITIPQNVGAIINGKAFVYAVQAGDTPISIATGLAALINAQVAGTTSTGAIITLPAGAKIAAARVGATGTSIRELKRQEKGFQISIWSDTPDHRKAVSSVVDILFSATPRMVLVDTTAAHLVYKGSNFNDMLQKAKLYKMDLFYTVEFATTQTETDTAIMAIQENVSDQPDGATATIATIQINT